MLDIFASCDYKRRRSFDVPAAPQTCDVFFHMKAYMSTPLAEARRGTPQFVAQTPPDNTE